MIGLGECRSDGMQWQRQRWDSNVDQDRKETGKRMLKSDELDDGKVTRFLERARYARLVADRCNH